MTTPKTRPKPKLKRNNHAKQIVVDLESQTLQAFEGGHVIFAFDCVTGDKRHQTQPGHYRILRKSPKHISHKYNVPMHWAMFFTTDGKAFHQYHGLMPLSLIRSLKENVTDELGSHGCVRMVEKDAKALYDWADFRTSVIISGHLT